MRLLTTLNDEGAARTLGDALYARGMPATVNATRDGTFAVWVHDEEKIDAAKEFLETFDPQSAEFVRLAQSARAQRKQEEKEVRELQARTEKMRDQIRARQEMRIGTVTLGLMAICVFFFVLTGMGDNQAAVAKFTFVPFKPVGGGMISFGHAANAWQSEPWRIITPVFLHFGLMHIIFNLWWLKDLGTVIERAFSARYLFVLVLAITIISHFVQYAFLGPSIFGGMSGVVYGLFGFIWIRGRFDPAFPYRIPQQLVMFMMIWFALCFTGWVGPIANGVHAGGLAVGGVWGFLSSGRLRRL